MHVLTRDAARAIDRACVEEFALPTIVLMENAALHAAGVAASMLDPPSEAARVLIVAGPGANGGDGLAIARHLHNQGVRVAILLAADPASLKGDADVQLGVVQKMALPLTVWNADDPVASIDRAIEPIGSDVDLVIDALFGSGLRRDVVGPHATLIHALNTRIADGADALAVDVPSGLDIDTGEPRGVAIRADVTVTFAAAKVGFAAIAAQPFVGEVVVADIGAPRALVERFGQPAPEPLTPADALEVAPASAPPPTPGR